MKYYRPAVLVFPASSTRKHNAHKNNKSGTLNESNGYIFQEISTMQEEALRKWLSQMGFDVPSGGNDSIDTMVTKDPLRNGTLLCSLVQMLDPDHGRTVLSRVIRNPLSIKSASINVNIALKVLRSRRYSAIPAPYLHQAEQIVKGHRAVLWGLLWHLKRTIDTFVPDPSELHVVAGRTPSGKAVLRQSKRTSSKTKRVSFFDQSSSSTTVDLRSSISDSNNSHYQHFYTHQESWQLERSLLSWLYSINAFKKCYPIFDGGVPNDLTDIETSLRNGTLLCVVAETITNNKVKGWIKRPKTNKVGRKNLEKGLDLLRSEAGFGQRFTWSGDAIHRGSRHDILGLLEDCHRYQDGLVARPKFFQENSLVDDGRPYFGSHVPDAADLNVPTPNYTYPKFDTPSAYIIGRGSHLGMNVGTDGGGHKGGGNSSNNGIFRGMNSVSSMMGSSTASLSGGGTQLNFDGGSSMLGGPSASRTMLDGSEGSGNGVTTENVVQSAMAESAVAASRSIPLAPSPQGRNILAPRDPSSPSFRSIHQSTFQSPSSISGSFNGASRGGGTSYMSHVSAIASTSSLIQDLSMQRDASNDIIPLPGHSEINDGRIPISSGVGPEHSMEAVHYANMRHHDVTRAINLKRNILHPGKSGGGGTVHDIIEWISKMNVPLERPHDLDTNVAPEFSNGVKLCMLVQKCELMRGALPGVNSEPKNQAQVSNL